ncbi:MULTISPECIES: hypothetical protein [unclassified Acidovorax]|uniref:hypothetical protein n=1 Tax=unclassified Acidovorax TaxID=2684926 RepID=UPI00288341AF|nr:MULTISPECIES: hypothetical protein [unclassified Acidovorax]
MLKSSAALCCALLVSFGASALELAKYPQVFNGPQGLEVALAPSRDGKQALMRVSGVNHPIDAVVFLGDREQRGASTEAYVTTLDGREHGLVQKQRSAYGGNEQTVAYLPGQRDAIALTYDEQKSKALQPSALLAVYDRQNKEGIQNTLARFDREKRMAQAQSALQRVDQTASESCGSQVKTTVDWSSVSEAQFKSLSIAGYCGEVASQLDQQCRSVPAFKQKVAELGQVNCRFGTEMKLRTENRQLIFTTQEDAPNQGDFVQQFLRNQ